jgi:hypothetical protein
LSRKSPVCQVLVFDEMWSTRARTKQPQSPEEERAIAAIYAQQRKLRSSMKRGEVAAKEALLLGKLLSTFRHTRSRTFKLGQKFAAGRRPGSGGPIRKAIARLLATNPSMKNAELWDTIAAKPPRGWRLWQDRDGHRHIDGPKGIPGMGYARFCTIASEERGR